MADLLEDILAYLVTQDLVRDPQAAGDEPPLWIEPQDGVPAPGEGENETEIGQDVVVGLFRNTGIATGRHEKFYIRPHVNFLIRSSTAPLAFELEQAIREALHDKRDWVMGGHHVIEALQVRELQRLGSDEKGYRYLTEYQFQVFAFAI